ncbi:ABC transporter substrate-binding protein [Seonamhaeicola algicola]|uniref:ABC transporter substrate-binding protein n=1 Tax=Seonamhaeicola algicola TaxID=1719036 RepID=A0A5C7AWP8_9FLAO|nr:two-component regulator propeller domain-containing protein [Seonamhaeicola algicola]TXE13140.1 ABC transporter substrate-binding protein [Seonamhaeicola algicola]
MLKKLIIILVIVFPVRLIAQDYSSEWTGHFSYFNIKDIIEAENKIFAVSDNAIFSLDVQTNVIEEYTTINGLSGEPISTIHYSDVYDLLIIGYENGLIEIVFFNGSDVLSVVDILEKTTIPPTQKKINHFNEYNNLLYIATNYGISVFNLERLEFGDTYFIGANGSQIAVNGTSVYNNSIYAACAGNNGIKKANVTSPNLINFQNWQTIISGSYLFIENTNSKLYTIGSNRKIYEIINDGLIERATYNNTPTDLKFSSSLVVTTPNNVFVYDENFNALSQVNIETAFNTTYTSATVTNNDIYIGSSNFGVLKTSFATSNTFEEIHPDGPLLNSPFSIKFSNNDLWVVFGGYGTSYDWNGGRRFSGVSKYSNGKWQNTVYDSINTTIKEPQFLSHITINPNNKNQVYISSYWAGLIEIEENKINKIYNQNNSTIVPFLNDWHLTLTSNFDSEGNLWLTNGRVDNPLNKFSNGNWQSFNFNSLIGDKFSNIGFSNIEFDLNNNLFFGSYNYGIIGFKENNGNHVIKSIMGENKNMPSNNVTASALDKRNQLWIGTDRGLRVLYNTAGFFDDDNIQVEEIIIEEDGITKELLFQQLITDIKVDGSNNKWIGTADSGLFYFSQDGQNTIYHFTKTNSPLPSNTINDISLDSANGIVYIATSRGLVSFKSGGSSPFEDLNNAYAYPNPVRPGFNITSDKVKIKDISENVNIKITDIEGNLVAEAQSNINQRHRGYNLEIDGGTAYWNGKNLANNLVASGVYLIMLSDLDTFETKVIKLMLVR